jgi:hypothetical protein
VFLVVKNYHPVLLTHYGFQCHAGEPGGAGVWPCLLGFFTAWMTGLQLQ